MRRTLAIGFAAYAWAFAACAANESAAPPAPEQDAGDAAVTPEAERPESAAPCEDCEYFPADCAPDILCSNSPFELPGGSNIDPRTSIFVIRGNAPNDVWVAGSVGGMAHFDGTSWTRSDLATQETQRVLWVRDTWQVATGTTFGLYTRGVDPGEDAGVSAGGWSVRPLPTSPVDLAVSQLDLTGSWPLPGSNLLWMSGVTAYGSGLWRMRFTPPSTFELIGGIAPSACGDIPCKGMLGVHGASPGTIWAVGENGATLRVSDADGDAPVARPYNSLTSDALRAVWAASDADVWSVGVLGAIRHYRGDPVFWEVVDDVPTKRALNGIWGTSATDIWAVGDAGVVLHYDGKAWSRSKIAGLGKVRPNLYAVWSPGPGHVWIAGQGVVASLGGKP